MRRWTRRILLAAVMLLGSCHGGSEMGVVEVDLYDERVDCDAESQTCYAAGEGEPAEDEDGRRVEPEPHRTWVFFSDQTSAHHPRGAYLYFEMVREDDVRAYVEIDVPTREGETDAAVMRYTEYRNEEVVFEADTAHGRVELAQDLRAEECSCADGRLELVFVDPGEDDELETEDDRVRRLSRARFSWDQQFCIVAQMLGMRDERVDVRVRRVERCTGSTPTPRYDSDPEPSDDSTSTYHADTTGCSGDGYDSGSTGGSSSGSSGCEGDSSSSGGGCEGDSSSSSGGCEGDSSSSSGGCSGDTSSSSGGCSGDTGGSSCSTTTIVPRTGACPRGGPAGPGAALASARVQLVLGIVLAIVWLDRRRRRRARRRS